jgi:hypothetical protein
MPAALSKWNSPQYVKWSSRGQEHTLGVRIIRGAEERHQLPLGEELVAILHDLRKFITSVTFLAMMIITELDSGRRSCIEAGFQREQPSGDLVLSTVRVSALESKQRITGPNARKNTLPPFRRLRLSASPSDSGLKCSSSPSPGHFTNLMGTRDQINVEL